MRQIKLRSGLILVVVAALVPVTILSVVQALTELDYTRSLLGSKLVISALATAGQQRDQIIIARQTLLTISQIRDVRVMNSGCTEGLKTGLAGHNSLLNFARSDAQGKVRCSITPFAPGMSFAKDLWWQNGKNKRGFSVSSPIFGPITKKEVLIGMQPLFAADGTFDGAVTVAIDFSWLKQSLIRQKLADYSVVGVTLADGRTLITSSPANLPQFEPARAVGQVIEASGKDGAIWMYSAAPLYGAELYLIYAEPRKALMATAASQARLNLVLPLIALLLTVIGIWFATNRLVINWLDALQKLAAQFAAGNYSGDPSRFDKAPEEMAALSTGLHAMANAVEQRDHDLTAALEAKTNMTLEIHHRVKNNLQIVSSLLNLQTRRISDPSAKSALDQTRARIGALAQIHRLLYEDSTDSELGHVDIAQLMTQLCIQLRSLHRHQADVGLVCAVDRYLLPVDNAVPLSLFAVEAITNVFRHGYPDGQGGTVTLSFSATEDEGQMQISDDGIGFDARNGFSSMGHQLMTAFAHQLGGKLEISSEAGSGTVVTLKYPLNGSTSNSQ